MKRTLGLITIIAATLIFLFTACNADATAGLFYQLAHSKEPVGIRYKQIIGRSNDENTLFYLTNNGIYSTNDGKTSTTIKKNDSGKPIYNAFLNTAKDAILYSVNGNSGLLINTIGLDGTGDTVLAPLAHATINSLTLKEIYANGLILISGSIAGKESISLTTLSLALNTLNDILNFPIALDGYDIAGVLQLTGREQWTLGDFNVGATTAPLILSLVKGSEYIHYYVNGANAYTINLKEPLVGFAMTAGKLYLLTQDGNLYSSGIPGGDNTPTAKIMTVSSKTYSKDAFIYLIENARGIHLITKSLASNEAMLVFSDIEGTKKPVEVTGGYASQMDNVNIVSAFEKDVNANKLLIATEKNGMFDIVINPADGDKSSNTGTSTGPEIYTVN